MEQINRLIGKRIQKLRRLKGFTQARLAEQLKCSTSYLSRIERGVETGALKFFVKLADCLDAPLKSLFDFDDKASDEKVEEIVLRVRDKDGKIREDSFVVNERS